MSHSDTVFKVRSYELDGLGHLNHAVFLNYFEQARFDALEAGGFSPSALAKERWGIHVVRIEVDYRRECRLGDTLNARTWIEAFRRTSMVIRQELLKIPERGEAMQQEPLGQLAAEARVITVWVGPDGQPMRIPHLVREALSPLGPDRSSDDG